MSFQRPDAPGTVRPAYMGLIKQIDDWLGRLFDQLKKLGRFDDTLIFFTADHGDFLGDHWLGEKEMFYEEALRVPFIVYDPDPTADATRGTVDRRFVEAIDVVPTIPRGAGPAGVRASRRRPVAAAAAARRKNRDLARRGVLRARLFLPRGTAAAEARAARLPRDMVRTDRWKYVWWQDFRPMLFDLDNDPKELRDLGANDSYGHVRRAMEDRLDAWLKARKTRVTVDDAYVEARTATHRKHGIYFGVW